MTDMPINNRLRIVQARSKVLLRPSLPRTMNSAGATSIADDADPTNPDRATELTTRANRLTLTAEELTGAARLYRIGSLD